MMTQKKTPKSMNKIFIGFIAGILIAGLAARAESEAESIDGEGLVSEILATTKAKYFINDAPVHKDMYDSLMGTLFLSDDDWKNWKMSQLSEARLFFGKRKPIILREDVRVYLKND